MLCNVKNMARGSMAAIAMATLSTTAAAQEACSDYTVKDGDSLGSIAQTAFGTFDYQMIFNANRNKISDPNRLEEGTLLEIPCADGNLASGKSHQDVIEEQEAIQAARAKKSNIYEPPIKIVSGNGWAPFTGEDLKGGGMLVRVASTAMQRGGNDREFTVSFVDDWGSHMETLLPLGAFDVSVAWIKPDCSKYDLLNDESRKRCDEYDFSQPIYETVAAYWSMPGNDYANVTSFADYAGARICRVDGWSTADLNTEGLNDPVVTFVRPSSAKECMELLAKGDVDMVSLDLENGAAAASEVPEAAEALPNPNLSKLETLHLITHKTNPRGRVYQALINRGLTEMRQSGEWYALISDSLVDVNNLSN